MKEKHEYEDLDSLETIEELLKNRKNALQKLQTFLQKYELEIAKKKTNN